MTNTYRIPNCTNREDLFKWFCDAAVLPCISSTTVQYVRLAHGVFIGTKCHNNQLTPKFLTDIETETPITELILNATLEHPFQLILRLPNEKIPGAKKPEVRISVSDDNQMLFSFLERIFDLTPVMSEPACELPIADGTLQIYSVSHGYEVILKNKNGVKKLFTLTERQWHKKSTKELMFQDILMKIFDNDGMHSMYETTFFMPNHDESVIFLPTERLWCTRCRTFVENTANYEMRREGCYSHSHVCRNKPNE